MLAPGSAYSLAECQPQLSASLVSLHLHHTSRASVPLPGGRNLFVLSLGPGYQEVKIGLVGAAGPERAGGPNPCLMLVLQPRTSKEPGNAAEISQMRVFLNPTPTPQGLNISLEPMDRCEAAVHPGARGPTPPARPRTPSG